VHLGEVRERRFLGLRRYHFRLSTSFERHVVDREVCDDALELAILLLKLAQTLGVARLHAAVFLLPPIQRLLADAVLAAHLLAGATRFGLLENRDDL